MGRRPAVRRPKGWAEKKVRIVAVFDGLRGAAALVRPRIVEMTEAIGEDLLGWASGCPASWVWCREVWL